MDGHLQQSFFQTKNNIGPPKKLLIQRDQNHPCRNFPGWAFPRWKKIEIEKAKTFKMNVLQSGPLPVIEVQLPMFFRPFIYMGGPHKLHL